jgi:hypothetical protein
LDQRLGVESGYSFGYAEHRGCGRDGYTGRTGRLGGVEQPGALKLASGSL